jgi:hypothetical protein
MGGEATVEGGLRLGIDIAWSRVLDRGAGTGAGGGAYGALA